jgi:hypothetical protein
VPPAGSGYEALINIHIIAAKPKRPLSAVELPGTCPRPLTRVIALSAERGNSAKIVETRARNVDPVPGRAAGRLCEGAQRAGERAMASPREVYQARLLSVSRPSSENQAHPLASNGSIALDYVTWAGPVRRSIQAHRWTIVPPNSAEPTSCSVPAQLPPRLVATERRRKAAAGPAPAGSRAAGVDGSGARRRGVAAKCEQNGAASRFAAVSRASLFPAPPSFSARHPLAI